MKGDTRSSDYSSCRVMEGCHLGWSVSLAEDAFVFAVLVVINIEAGGAVPGNSVS